jgi:hypothetical protein
LEAVTLLIPNSSRHQIVLDLFDACGIWGNPVCPVP